MAFSIDAALTDGARQRLAQMTLDGKAFMVTHFAVSNSGADPMDPTTALAPDTEATVCPGSPPLFGPEPIDSRVMISTFCPQFTCVLELAEAVGSISNLCLIATIIFSPIPMDAEVGTTFLYGVANMPLQVKTPFQRFTYLVNVQY